MFSTPQHMEYSSPTDMSRPGDEMDTHKGPVLFGNKRRSTAVARTPSFMSNSPMVGISAPSSDIFASPAQTALPSHMREATPSGGKSVHWSPALVTDRNMSSPLVKPTQGICTPSSNAPPLKSLRDGFDSTQKSTRRSLSTAVTHPLNQTNSSIIMGNDSAIEETTSSSDNWVTVFGFFPDQAHSILQYMSRHGEVVMHQVPSKGNWMYVGYSCSTHARQALSRNGAVLDGNIRIGVIPTSEKELTGLNVGQISTSVPITLNRSTLFEQSIREEPEEESILQTRDQNVSIFDNSMNNSRMSTVSRAGMRPLNNSFRPREVPLEEKTETFMSKLWNTVGF